MSKITTDDCKKFIAQFQKDNPALERIRFGIKPEETIETNRDLQYLQDCLDPKNWKRLFKRKMTDEDSNSIYVSGQSFNRYAATISRVRDEDVRYVRGFDMDKASGQIAYLVLEMNDGILHLGEYIGDWLTKKENNTFSFLLHKSNEITHHRHHHPN